MRTHVAETRAPKMEPVDRSGSEVKPLQLQGRICNLGLHFQPSSADRFASAPAAAGESGRLHHDFSQVLVRASGDRAASSIVRQAQAVAVRAHNSAPPMTGASPAPLMLDRPNDHYEQQAERIADRVVRTVAAQTRTPHAVPAATTDRSPVGAEAAPLVASTFRRPGGAALPPTIRSQMEHHLGHDFDKVRIHADAHSDALNRRLNAHAFTHGPDIYFAASRFDPGTESGRHLLAHELAHVKQQASSDATPAIQRSAKAYFEDVGFEEQAELGRELFEDTLRNEAFYPSKTANFFVKVNNRRKRRRFERQLSRIDPEKHQARLDEVGEKFADRPKKRLRREKGLEKRRRNAHRKLDKTLVGAGGFPRMQRVLVISATYHYVPVSRVGGQQVEFSQSVLDEVMRKFKVGSTWQDMEWKDGEKIGVRFDIGFKQHKNAASLSQIDGKTPGDIPMRVKPHTVTQHGTIDYAAPGATDGKAKTNIVSKPDNVGEASFAGIAIDTKAIRDEKYLLRYYEWESDRTLGIKPREDIVTPTTGVDLEQYMASVIAHEIGHNIGMIHHDRGIMAENLQPDSSLMPKRHIQTDQQGTTQEGGVEFVVDFSFPDVEVRPHNVQALVDRIEDMSIEQQNYWNKKRRQQYQDGRAKPPSEHAGFTVLQK